MPLSPRTLRPSSSFSPRSISGLALWLDASYAPSLFQSSNGTTAASASGDPVGYWGDRSGNGKNATQGTANNRPTIATVKRNNRNTVRFDGLDDFLSFTDVNLQTIFVVCVCQDAGKNLNSLIGYRDPNSSQSFSNSGIRRDSSPANTTTWRGIDNTNINDFTNTAGSQFRVSGVSTNSVNDGVWHLVTAMRNTSTLDNINNIGAWFEDREFGGDIAEIICYTRFVTNAERDKVEKYVAGKWGLTIG